jgi:hypothetical protein
MIDTSAMFGTKTPAAGGGGADAPASFAGFDVMLAEQLGIAVRPQAATAMPGPRLLGTGGEPEGAASAVPLPAGAGSHPTERDTDDPDAVRGAIGVPVPVAGVLRFLAASGRTRVEEPGTGQEQGVVAATQGTARPDVIPLFPHTTGAYLPAPPGAGTAPAGDAVARATASAAFEQAATANDAMGPTPATPMPEMAAAAHETAVPAEAVSPASAASAPTAGSGAHSGDLRSEGLRQVDGVVDLPRAARDGAGSHDSIAESATETRPAPGPAAPAPAGPGPAAPGRGATSGLVDRIVGVVDMLQNQPPPRSFIIEVPQLDGAQIRVALRPDGSVHLGLVGERPGDLAMPVVTAARAALHDRGFDLGPDDRGRRQRHVEDDAAELFAAGRRRTTRPVDSGLRI